jgi:D-amino peptidase
MIIQYDRMVKILRSLLIGVLLCAIGNAQKPRFLIVTDMEGVGGVNNAEEQLLPGQRRYDESRRLLVGELNAAIKGLLDAGARQVVVWDGHDGSRSLSIADIDPAAELIQGRPTPANYYLQDRLYDGILFVGQHAMAGARNGVLAHSQSFSVERISLNGRSVGEIGQVAAIAGYFHIPVIMLAGDQAACDEILELQPKAETVAVKRGLGKASALSLSHGEACKRIHDAASRAAIRVDQFMPWSVEGPVELKFEFKDKSKSPNRVYRGATVLEAFQAWLPE